MAQNDDPWFSGGAPSNPPPTSDPFGLNKSSDSPFTSPGAPSSGVPASSKPLLITRPVSMHVAFGALVLSAVLSLMTTLLGVLTVLDLQGRVQNLVGLEPSGVATMYSDDYIDGATIALVVVMVAVAAAFAFGYIMFARGVYLGKRWPRTWAAGLAVVSLFGLLGGPLVVAIVVLGLVAVGALWLPVSRRYCDYASTRM